MIDPGDSLVVQESPRESLFKVRYFVSGCCIGSGSGITKRLKDQALEKETGKKKDHSNIALDTILVFILELRLELGSTRDNKDIRGFDGKNIKTKHAVSMA